MAPLNIVSRWQRLWPGKWRIAEVFDAADLVPEKLPRNGAVLVGTTQRPKWLVFDCPCRRGHRIMLTLDAAHRPHWKVTDFDNLSLWPSVDYVTDSQRCHYILKDGRVLWVPNKVRRN